MTYKIETILAHGFSMCDCGCGETIPTMNHSGKLLRYKKEHQNIGKTRTKETRKKYSQCKLGENNPMWKGNGVGYAALHEWVTSRLPKPEFCEICNEKKPYDLANISGKYLRDLSDWQWLCRSCHMKSDGRLDKLKMGLT